MPTDRPISRALLDVRRAALAIVVLLRFGGGPFFRRLAGLPPRGPSGPIRLRLALERLGITYLKLGQFLAMRFDVLPAAYCQELGNLFDGVPADPVDTARDLVEAELGRPISQLFAEFEADALAAGSIAQVHCARTLDGQRVAVKVQRPGIRTIFAADMRNLRRVATLFDAVGGAGFASFRDMVDDFASWTTREMDFTQEGRTADHLRELALDYEVVPAVYWDLSTSRVLTLELLDGPNAIQVQKLLDEGGRERLTEAYPTIDLDVVMRRLSFISLRQLFVTGFFHGDPHPGNVIILADNRVGLIDFGIFGELASSEREIWRRHFQAFAIGDIREAIYQYGRLIVTDPDSDVVAFQREAYLMLEKLYHAHRDPHTPPAERHIARSSSAVFELLRQHRLRVTLNNLLFWRTLVALNASAFRLSPTFDLIGVQRQFFDAYGPDPIDEAWTVFRDALTEQIGAVLNGEPDRAAQVLALESRGELKLNAIVHATEPTARDQDRHARALALALVALSLAVAGLGSALDPAWRTAMLFGAVPAFGIAVLAEARA